MDGLFRLLMEGERGKELVVPEDEMREFILDKIRPKGKWIDDKCSNCGWEGDIVENGTCYYGNYCPNCGAEMESEE